MSRRLAASLVAFSLLTSGVSFASAPTLVAAKPPATKAAKTEKATEKGAAAQALVSPLTVVKQGNESVQQTLSRETATVEELATTVDGFVDFGELARRALGKEWEKLTPAQRTDFSGTMKGLLRASYAQKAIGQGSADIRYGEEKVEGNEATVPTKLVVKKDEFPVDYKLYRADEKSPWRIYDVITDEVSLVETYRGQFRKLMAEKGFDGLLNTLKAKREQLEKGSAKPVKG